MNETSQDCTEYNVCSESESALFQICSMPVTLVMLHVCKLDYNHPVIKGLTHILPSNGQGGGIIYIKHLIK